MKMTKKVALSTAIEVLSADNANDEAVSILQGMIEQLERKAASASSCPRSLTARQKENEAIKAEIPDIIRNGAHTIPEIIDAVTVETAHELTSQRMNAILLQLIDAHKVIRNNGRSATYSVVEDEAEQAE